MDKNKKWQKKQEESVWFQKKRGEYLEKILCL